jgi:hypothetical protein
VDGEGRYEGLSMIVDLEAEFDEICSVIDRCARHSDLIRITGLDISKSRKQKEMDRLKASISIDAIYLPMKEAGNDVKNMVVHPEASTPAHCGPKTLRRLLRLARDRNAFLDEIDRYSGYAASRNGRYRRDGDDRVREQHDCRVCSCT